VLKDYSFDLLKLDMLFLRRFNEKSRSIITSIVRMAKRLGIHTLAEGVETLEQVNFLQSIGCERIQGYYYGKPMPYEAFHQYYGQHHYPLETAQETKLYQTVGLVDCLSEAPLAICFSSGQEASLLFANQALLKNLRLLGIRDIHQYNRYLQLPDHPLRVRLLQMLAKVRLLKKKRAYIFAERGRYFRITAELLSETEQLQAYRLSLSNVTMEHWESQTVQRFDAIMHNLYLSFHEIFLLNLRRDTCELLVSHDVTYESGRRYRDIDAFFSQYAQQNICEEDRQRFLSYMKRKKLQGLGSGKNGLHDIDSFRIRQDDGSDLWVRFDAVRAYFVDKEEILISVQPLSFEQKGKQETLNRIAESFGMRGSREITADILRDAMLWRSFAIPTQLMMFYKDRERRFVWANKAFLDFCGFKSLEDILGRTDEDLALHINSRAFREVEEKVLTTGETVHRQLGEILIHGHSALVYSTKYPYNVHGRVEGLVGISWAFEQSQRNYHDAVHDADTGLFNYRGMLISGIEFMDNYLRNDRDFVAVYFSVPAFGDIARKYGETARLHLLQRITRELLRGHKKGGIIAHIGSCRFIGFFQKGKNDIGVRVLQLANAIHNIRSVDGFPCTLYLQYAIGYGSETKSIEGLLRLLVKRVEEAKASRFGESIYIGDRIAFDREKFDSMDERVYMSDPETYDLVYINQAVYKDLHLPEDFSYQGRKCYEVIVGGSEPCEFCTNRLLRRDRFYNWTYHNPISGIDYLLRDTFVPWRGKNYRFSMAINLNEYLSRDLKANETLYREAAINDAISIAMREEDPSEGIRKMLWKVGSELDADRICIFELDEDGTSVSNTYEWCRSGIEPMRARMQHLPMNPCYIYRNFRENHFVMIPDYEAYRKAHPEAEQYLPDIHRFIAVPLKISDRIIGHLQIVNPQPSLFKTTDFLMMTLSRFIASMIRNREALKELEHMSQRDQLTGLLNRRGLSQYFAALPDDISCAFIFGDINGLKRMNDERGHEAGDRLITTVSAIMEEKQREAGKGHVFRMGGDEFLMIIEDMDEQGAKALMENLRRDFRAHEVSVALGSLVCMTPLTSLDPILVKVDQEMYKDKGQMKR
jgi:diguanylate cyclase (GGDEF)-like protein